MFFPLMHVLHLITVILWIGGLGFITILVLPLIIKMPDPLQKVLFFQGLDVSSEITVKIFSEVRHIHPPVP